MDMQTAIEEWAIETANFYDSIACSKFNKAFYTQSDLRKIKASPELMIIATNPGGYDCSYQEQIDNPLWKEWGINNIMDGATFLKGNPTIETDGIANIEKWHLWKRLRTILSFGNMEAVLNDSSQYIYTNVVCFNTRKAKDVPSWIFKNCTTYTLKLIRITQPKMILCLGHDCFKHLCDAAKVNAEVLLSNEITRAWIHGVLVIHIPHTSKYYSYEEMALIGRSLYFLREMPNIPSSEFFLQIEKELKAFRQRIPAQNVSKQIAIEVEKVCYNQFKEQNFVPKHPWCLLPQNLMLCISHTSNGIVAIRHREFLSNNTYSEKLQKLLNDYAFSAPNNKAWLGLRSFKSYGKTVEEISKNIIVDVKLIIKTLENKI